MSQANGEVRPWKIISSTKALDEKWFQVRRDVVQLPSGKIVDDYFLWEGPHIVAAIAVTPEGKFVLVRQYRHAINEIIYQFPAGAVDKGEKPAAAAMRELLEESGYTSDETPIHLGTMAPYGTKITPVEDFYLLNNARQVGQPRYDEQEESEVHLLTEDEVWEIVDSKQLLGGTFCGGLLLALRHLKKAV